MKYIITFLLIFSQPIFAQQTDSVTYATMSNSPLTESSAHVLRNLYKKQFYEAGKIKKVEYLYNVGTTQKAAIVEYCPDKGEDWQKVRQQYGKDDVNFAFFLKERNYVDGFRIERRRQIASSHSLPMPNQQSSKEEIQVFDDKSRIVAIQEIAKNSKGEKKILKFYKIFYNQKGTSLLVCDFIKDKYEVYADDDYLEDDRKPVEVFNLNAFELMKGKYFPNEDISYYKDKVLERASKSAAAKPVAKRSTATKASPAIKGGTEYKRNENGSLVCVEHKIRGNSSLADYTKTIKRFYDKEGRLVFECSYNSNGTVRRIKLLQPDSMLAMPQFFEGSKWNNFKLDYFPEEDIEYYKAAKI